MDRLASITGRVARPDPGQELGSRPRVGFSNQTLARSRAYDLRPSKSAASGIPLSRLQEP
jgi:hypothetical protein